MCAPEFSDIEVTIWQEFRDQGFNVIGISNEPVATIQNFIQDQGITFPILHDDNGIYQQYNIPGGQSPYPRDYLLDRNGIIRMAKTEYDPGTMIELIEMLLDDSTVNTNDESFLPDHIYLFPSVPNPFNPATALRFYLPSGNTVNLEIIDILGRAVAILFDQQRLSAGQHRILWNGQSESGRKLPSGVYFVRLQAGGEVAQTKLILMR
ncbi:MAG: redoxin domain-containing protein [Fidelibacterota bacterium]